MNSRFPVLSTISTLLRVLGIIIAVVAVLGFLTRAGSDFGQAVIVLIGGAISAIYIYAVAELIGVAFAIEQNTRDAAEAIGRLRMTSAPAPSAGSTYAPRVSGGASASQVDRPSWMDGGGKSKWGD